MVHDGLTGASINSIERRESRKIKFRFGDGAMNFKVAFMHDRVTIMIDRYRGST